MHSTPRPFMQHLTRLARSHQTKDNSRRTTSTTSIPTICVLHSITHTVRSGKPCCLNRPIQEQDMKAIFPISSYFFSILSIPNQRALSTNATMRRARPIHCGSAMHSQWPQLQSVPQFGLQHAQTLSGLTRRLGTGAKMSP